MFLMEHPITSNLDDLGVPPFWETSNGSVTFVEDASHQTP